MLDAELAYWQLSFDQLALVGFSQGSMMALHHAATSDTRLRRSWRIQAGLLPASPLKPARR
jgi:predicted esterase